MHHYIICHVEMYFGFYMSEVYIMSFFFFLSQKRKHLTMTMFLKYFVHRLKKKKYFWSFCNTGEDVIKSPGFLFQSQKNIFFFFFKQWSFYILHFMFLFVVCVKSVRYLCFFLTLDMLASNYNFPLTMTSSRITDNNIYFQSHVATIN